MKMEKWRITDEERNVGMYSMWEKDYFYS